jgi:NAD(P)-dependent dehydrogenase (short-subunit alcohol dehydrogenase family)
MFSRIANQYQGSTALVIGAGGIGGEIIRLLAPSVGKLVVADFNESLLASLQDAHPSALLTTRKLDVSDSGAVADFASFVNTTVGPPQFLFYAVGILSIEPFLATTTKDWERAVSINLNGAFYCTKAMAELMVPQKRGSILLLGSIAGTKARSGSRVNPVYNTTKAGLAAFVNATAMQLRGQGVRINCISPGPTATTMMDIQPSAVHASVREITLDQRMNNPAEVAELALFVAAHGRFTGEDVGLGGGAGLGG